MTHIGQQKEDTLQFTFENLIVYQKALLFVDFVYKFTSTFPKEEEYRIKSQLIRAAQSIALNIAEGSGGSDSEFRYFLRIAKRSTRECIVCVTISRMQDLIDKETEFKCRQDLVELSKMIAGLMNSTKPK
jgi:four helix bundle protein